MSLTSILGYRDKEFKDFRDFLKDLFVTPKFRSDESIKAEPLTTNHMLIGTAFDYLLRFNLERKYRTKVHTRQWVSENALRCFKDRDNGVIYNSSDELDGDDLIKLFEDRRKKDKEQNKRVLAKFKNCKKIYQQFINSKLTNRVKLIETCLFLGRLDSVFRGGPEMKQYINFQPEDKLDVKDLIRLLEICDLNLFKPKNKIILNPEFGKGSGLVGGADADIIIDDTLIDIKVTKKLKLTRLNYNQLIGYYLLYLIGGVSEHKGIKIKKLGIYFARHNVLWTVEVDKIGDKKLFETARDFLKRKIRAIDS